MSVEFESEARLDKTSDRTIGIVFCGLCVAAAVVIAGFAVWYNAPFEHEVCVRFEVDAGEGEVFVHGQSVGSTPLELSHDELEALWIPLDVEVHPHHYHDEHKVSEGDFRENWLHSTGTVSGAGEEHAWVVYRNDGTGWARHLLRYKVLAEDGRALGHDKAIVRVYRSGQYQESTRVLRFHMESGH